jgi:predicted unusual protein kinase regulating ubiquinone biosynthesis (AarF/ABC1/UbiB family)
MEYSVKGRTRKVNKLVFKIIIRVLFFKLYARLLSVKLREEKLGKLHTKIANEVVATIIELEGLFLKVGQLISTFSSILPEPYVKAFDITQNHSSVRPFDQIKTSIERELKLSIDKVFREIDEVPLGTASIGQVHKGILLTGETVAIKVQHLNISEIAELDLKLIDKVLKIIQFFIKIKGFDSVFEEIVVMIHQELDYEHEAVQMNRISSNLKEDTRVIVPAVFQKYCTKRILVMEFLEGNKITDKNFIEDHNLDPDIIAKNVLDVFSKTIFLDGIYHADPHPGNVLLNKNGQIILLDFGAIGILGDQMKEGLFILMQATVLKDENLMISGFKKMGFITDAPGINGVCKKLIKLLGDYLQDEIKIKKFNLNEIEINDIEISKIFDLIKKIDLKEIEDVVKIPKDWVLLNRTFTLLIGVTSEISPEIDTYKIVKPNLLKMFVEKENLGMILKTSLQQQIIRLMTLPRKMEMFLEDAENGTLQITVKNRSKEVKLFYELLQQLVFIIGTVFSYYFYKSINDISFFYIAIGSLLLFFKSFIYGFILKRKLK